MNEQAINTSKLTVSQPFSVVLRIGDVQISKVELDSALGVVIDRFEPQCSGGFQYAQINLPDCDDCWPMIIEHIQRIGPKFRSLQEQALIGDIFLDLADTFGANLAMHTLYVPSAVLAIIGTYGIGLELTTFLESDEE